MFSLDRADKKPAKTDTFADSLQRRALPLQARSPA